MKRRVIALTGGIGSGKSEVAKILTSRYSFDVLDCDKLSREVATDSELLFRVQQLLGADSVVDGELNRSFVREMVFCNDELYNSYSNLFWKKIRRLLEKKLALLGQTVFVEIPVLEAFHFDWSEIWLVESSDDSRLLRVVQRDGVALENVRDIMSKQKKCVNFTQKIINNGSIDDLKENVEVALKNSRLI